MTLEEIKEKSLPILLSNGATFAAVFGSYSRHEERESSDVDILVKFSPGISLTKLIRIENRLSDVLKKKVDLVEEGGLEKSIQSSVYQNLNRETVWLTIQQDIPHLKEHLSNINSEQKELN